MTDPAEHNTGQDEAFPRPPSVLSNGSTSRKRTRDDKLKASSDNPSDTSRDGRSSPEDSSQTLSAGGNNAVSSDNNRGINRNTRFSSEDLLAPVARFDWDEFQEQCRDGIQDTNTEEAALLEEYRQWQWLHHVWTQSRSASDTVRLNQEIRTISRWTELKEAELEEARMQHKHNLEQISKVLGIFSPS